MLKVREKQCWLKLLLIICVVLLAGLVQNAAAMTDEDCLDCHTDPDLTVEVEGKTIQLTVDGEIFMGSIHADNGCVSCHEEADVEEAPHDYPLAKVDCANCHDEIAETYAGSLHGQAIDKNDPYAPKCTDCHGKHDILSSQDVKSPTYILNVPFTCGRCHQEGSPMTLTHNIPKKNILKNFSMSIHGEGLYRKGLTVTAVCSSCHTAHNVLPHTDPKSTISRVNVVKTCMKCHANIEEAHTKIVRGELWETEPHKIPACVECHGPHKARRVLYEDSLNDKFCLKCHGNPDLKKILANGEERSLYVNVEDFEHSIHKDKRIACAKCHVNVDHQKSPVCQSSGKVDCSICHAEVVDLYEKSTHGILVAKNDKNAPNCTECHGTHGIKSRTDFESPIFARNVPDLCARCHREGEKAALRYTGSQHDIIKHYQMSIHGRGLSQSGLMVSATCTNCHTAHSMLPASDPDSSVHRDNIITACAQCHLGISEKFSSSIHSPTVSKTDKKLPVCNDCHTSHTISRHDTAGFRGLILDECGTCHDHETDTYFETYHGKASMLSGGEKTAKCSDCHGSHDILPAYYSESRLNRRHVVETCKKCHPGSNRKFTGYLTHATHHDRDKYPYLYYTFWGMTGLLVGTFAFFGIHTLFWVPRSFRERFKRRRQHSHQKIMDGDDDKS
ncbi:MAG: cytochrome c3 family protein [Desulfobulbales bacterium]|nr:cytochrome c3 family protein [Desulfobulbales bacterium]